MSSEQFYVCLPSRSSATDFPHNTPSKYKTRFPKTYILDKPYEVALATLSYPVTYYNVVARRNGFTVKYKNTLYAFTVPPGLYTNEKDVIESINSILQTYDKEHNTRLHDAVEFIFTQESGRVTLNMALGDNYPNSVHFKQPSLLGEILGFPRSTIGATTTNLQRGRKRASTDMGILPQKRVRSGIVDIKSIRQIYVYCDLVKHSYVGTHSVPLLRTLTAGGSFGKTVEKEFYVKQYIPLNVSEFSTVEINLTDSEGVPIGFDSGEVIAVLHFRPIKN